MNQPVEQPKPNAPKEWGILQIQDRLKRPLPQSALKSRTQGGASFQYAPWYVVNTILDKYAPGWCWEIRDIKTTEDRVFITGRLTIPTADGLIWREATGTELLKEDKPIKQNGNVIRDEYGQILTRESELAYGDPSSNAESMAFRRCAARFGLALYLYEKNNQ